MPLVALILTELTAELALFAAAGFLLFAIDDLAVDLIYFARRAWRSLVIYSRFPRMSPARYHCRCGRGGWRC